MTPMMLRVSNELVSPLRTLGKGGRMKERRLLLPTLISILEQSE